VKDKVVVISGASRGLGKALAVGFAEQGCSLGVCARDKTRLAALKQVLKKMECPHVASPFDVANDTAVHDFVQTVLSTFGRIDVLINNASILGPRNEIVSYPTHSWKEVMDININGAFYLTKYALKIMLAQNEGSIINISSSVGRVARGTWGAYAVSKIALEGLTELLSVELRDTGIRANSVNPGAIATDMRREDHPEEDPTQLKKPEEILDIFFYLASDDSRGISGQRFDAQNFHSTLHKVN
jgi:NAD(P)-dependent dehydrogenase (short-subunit alcohol dehydrogenase family)